MVQFTLFLLTLDLESYGKNVTFAVAGYEGTRRVTRHGIAAIPDPNVRTAVSTTGSVVAMIVGVGNKKH